MVGNIRPVLMSILVIILVPLTGCTGNIDPDGSPRDLEHSRDRSPTVTGVLSEVDATAGLWSVYEVRFNAGLRGNLSFTLQIEHWGNLTPTNASRGQAILILDQDMTYLMAVYGAAATSSTYSVGAALAGVTVAQADRHSNPGNTNYTVTLDLTKVFENLPEEGETWYILFMNSGQLGPAVHRVWGENVTAVDFRQMSGEGVRSLGIQDFQNDEGVAAWARATPVSSPLASPVVANEVGLNLHHEVHSPCGVTGIVDPWQSVAASRATYVVYTNSDGERVETTSAGIGPFSTENAGTGFGALSIEPFTGSATEWEFRVRAEANAGTNAGVYLIYAPTAMWSDPRASECVTWSSAV